MINLFEDYSQGSWDLHYSLIVAGYVNTTVCLSDNGFLPSDVTSPYLFFTGFDKVQGSATRKSSVLIRNVAIFTMRILLISA